MKKIMKKIGFNCERNYEKNWIQLKNRSDYYF